MTALGDALYIFRAQRRAVPRGLPRAASFSSRAAGAIRAQRSRAAERSNAMDGGTLYRVDPEDGSWQQLGMARGYTHGGAPMPRCSCGSATERCTAPIWMVRGLNTTARGGRDRVAATVIAYAVDSGVLYDVGSATGAWTHLGGSWSNRASRTVRPASVRVRDRRIAVPDRRIALAC